MGTTPPDKDLPWDELDPLILAGAKVHFLKRVCDASGMDLRAALELLDDRYNLLRQTRPDEFQCSHEEYWKGFYS
jgi:hypothetical protein